MISFNPGPSFIRPEIRKYAVELVTGDFLSTSHRGERFADTMQAALKGVREALSVPKDYTIVFQPSATAAMECVLRNLVFEKSFHFHQVSFICTIKIWSLDFSP